MMITVHPFANPTIAAVFDAYAPPIRAKLLFLRQLIFETAAQTEGVGDLTEALKWGQPSYLTAATKSGSTIRIDAIKSHPDQFGIYFICSTTLVETFREIYGDLFTYEGNRCLRFHLTDTLPQAAIADCFSMALTYHQNKGRL